MVTKLWGGAPDINPIDVLNEMKSHNNGRQYLYFYNPADITKFDTVTYLILDNYDEEIFESFYQYSVLIGTKHGATKLTNKFNKRYYDILLDSGCSVGGKQGSKILFSVRKKKKCMSFSYIYKSEFIELVSEFSKLIKTAQERKKDVNINYLLKVRFHRIVDKLSLKNKVPSDVTVIFKRIFDFGFDKVFNETT